MSSQPSASFPAIEASRVALLVGVVAVVEARGGSPWQADSVINYLDNPANWNLYGLNSGQPVTANDIARLLDGACNSIGLVRRYG